MLAFLVLAGGSNVAQNFSCLGIMPSPPRTVAAWQLPDGMPVVFYTYSDHVSISGESQKVLAVPGYAMEKFEGYHAGYDVTRLLYNEERDEAVLIWRYFGENSWSIGPRVILSTRTIVYHDPHGPADADVPWLLHNGYRFADTCWLALPLAMLLWLLDQLVLVVIFGSLLVGFVMLVFIPHPLDLLYHVTGCDRICGSHDACRG